VVLTPPPRPLPDLVVSFFDGTEVTVRNVGPGQAGPSTLLLGSAGYLAVPPLRPQGQHTFRGLPCPAGGSSAIADAANQVVEEQEGNNLAFGGPFACVPLIPTTAASASESASGGTTSAPTTSAPTTSAPTTSGATSTGPPRTSGTTTRATTPVTTGPTSGPTTGATTSPTEVLTVTVQNPDFGSVSDGHEIACGQKCTFPYPEGTSVNLSAEVTPSGRFVEWKGQCDHINRTTCQVKMDGAKRIFAIFDAAPVPLQVQIDPAGAGFVVGRDISCPKTCTTEVTPGTRVGLSEKAAKGFVFKGWSGACEGAKNPCTFTPEPGTPVTVTATFESG
jgi:uncharacterized repeat protein (TIGR02543 family)